MAIGGDCGDCGGPCAARRRPGAGGNELELEGLVAAAFGQGGQIPFDGDFLVDLNLDPTDYVITVDIGIW